MLKEKTILSIIFDMDTQPNHMYQPIVTMRYNAENPERPIKYIVSHGWDKVEFSYGFTEKFRKLLENSKVGVAKFGLNELLPKYTGKKKASEIYVSDFGIHLPFCKNHDIVVKEYFNK